ncbi:hypothetical protein HK099_006704 [Clydaea vesicula]|uniref:Methylenetetrahydrofolate dehydrogenase [NAD(+)] n=1 Tax=Clydaea vesicula TaxID=447962 RepID=A0AAD5Y442_9FUNG|nr:hypothetical protein HK099_006704 [Clydaea vesicula]KAJ3396926.1 hypothetical protein HDU92_001499 [Lobulomyces angularis]
MSGSNSRSIDTKSNTLVNCKTILASSVAKSYISQIKESVLGLSTNETPLLVGFLANNDEFARKYAEWTEKTCNETGIRFELRECQRTELENMLDVANYDEKVHGIMVYYPVFGGSQDQYLQNSISVMKDVEGLCHTYRSNMYHNIRFLDPIKKEQKCILPCTPLAMLKILEYIGVYNKILTEGNRLHGKTITVINRSEVVGRPLASLLANDGANVYSVDINDILLFHRGAGILKKRHEVSETKVKLEEALAKSDVVITGVPSQDYKLDSSLLKEGVIAVNFSSFKNFNDDIKKKASIYVPSVGKVTVAMLERNLLRLYGYQKKIENL